MSFSPFSWVWACCSIALFLSSCAQLERVGVGDSVASPFDMVRVNKWSDFLLVSAAFDGRFDDGNILRLNFENDSIQKKQVVTVPTLGSRLALNEDESLLAVGFAGGQSFIRVYDVGAESLATEPRAQYSFGEDRIITDLDWFSVPLGETSRTFLAAELNGNSATARVQLLEWVSGGLTPAFRIPDDLPDSRTPLFDLGHASPTFIPDQNLLVFFPSEGLGIEKQFPSPYEVEKDKVWNAESDPRAVSLIAVDMERWAGGMSLEDASSYAPLVFNDSGKTVVAEEAADSESNKTLSFRTVFSESEKVSATDCPSLSAELGATATGADGVLAAHVRQGHLIHLGNWSAFKEAYRAKVPEEGRAARTTPATSLGTGEDSALETKNRAVELLFPGVLSLRTLEQGEGSTVLPEGLYRTTQISLQKINDRCQPVVARAEIVTSNLGQTNAGREKVWVTRFNGTTPETPLALQLSERAAIRFAGSGSDIYFASFSQNSFTKVTVLDSEIQQVQVLRESN